VIRQLSRKICLLGAFAVGKTSLVERFVYNRFSETYLTTLGVRVSQKLLPPVTGNDGSTVQYNLIIWDIAGMEKFDRVVMNYFRGAAGALAVVDVTRPETVDMLMEIVQRFRSVSPKAELLFLGNKIDLPASENALQLLKKMAREYQSSHLTTSARTGENVEKAFLQLAGRLP